MSWSIIAGIALIAASGAAIVLFPVTAPIAEQGAVAGASLIVGHIVTSKQTGSAILKPTENAPKQ